MVGKWTYLLPKCYDKTAWLVGGKIVLTKCYDKTAWLVGENMFSQNVTIKQHGR